MKMKNILYIVGGLVAAGVLVVAGFFLYLDITGGDSEATRDIEDELVEVEAAEGAQVFQILPAESEARFIINEVFAGESVTTEVVGSTTGSGGEQDIIGQLAIDPANPQATELGTIAINIKTLETETGRPGDENRDDAIRSRILLTTEPENEFAYFAPTQLVGLPETVTIGEPFSFQVIGDLTIMNETNTVTFEMTVTPTSETRIEGTGSTTINYPDYGISVSAPSFIASIEDVVRLEIDFVAEAIEGDPAAVVTESPFGA